ncbi:MAG: hypothetical protein U5J97_03375 [Trueperaceae bacterium]|nr:hypothetical protein [Trueperaceae bacterium]
MTFDRVEFQDTGDNDSEFLSPGGDYDANFKLTRPDGTTKNLLSWSDKEIADNTTIDFDDVTTFVKAIDGESFKLSGTIKELDTGGATSCENSYDESYSGAVTAGDARMDQPGRRHVRVDVLLRHRHRDELTRPYDLDRP